jgi:hypothetical protein
MTGATLTGVEIERHESLISCIDHTEQTTGERTIGDHFNKSLREAGYECEAGAVHATLLRQHYPFSVAEPCFFLGRE